MAKNYVVCFFFTFLNYKHMFIWFLFVNPQPWFLGSRCRCKNRNRVEWTL